MKPTNERSALASKLTVAITAAALLVSGCGDATEPGGLATPMQPAQQQDSRDAAILSASDGAIERDSEAAEDQKLDAAVSNESGRDTGVIEPPSPTPSVEGLPEGAQKIAGIEFFQRIVGKWSGITSNTPTGFDFPMAVDIAVSDQGSLFGKYEIDADNNVLWGFNIETYDGKDVLAYRNGGYLFGLRRDSRAKLVEHDAARGFYRFCAVLEHGLPRDGCNYIDATYTFSAPDKLVFEVKTHAGKLHVHWEARRVQAHTLPNPFPATITSQGNGSAAWPAAAGIK